MRVFDGLKVLDVASYVAAPAAATILSDFGAEVVKIEPPQGGDGYRLMAGSLPNLPRSEHNYAWALASRNKRGLALDLQQAAGRAVLHRLAAQADVLITNYPPSVRPRLGLDPQALAAINPRLVFASITGYGETGPEADRRGYDATAYFARSGLTDVTRCDEHAPPAAPALGQGDGPTASTLYGAIVTALYRRERTGRGGYVSSSLLANGIWSNGPTVQAALCGAEIPYRWPRTAPRSALSNFYLCRDGRWFSIAMAAEERLWPGIVRLLALDEIARDPRFATLPERRRHARALTEILDGVFARRDAVEWQRLFESEGHTVSVVARVADVAADAQAIHAGALVPADGIGGASWTVDSPFRIDGEEKCRPRAAPALGEHSDQVLADYGFGAEEIAALRAEGVVTGAAETTTPAASAATASS
ncbi:CaiB/BaiF CoA-transferase family protein [Piscinibacter sakaiensis]|uniref:Putative hydroxyproline dehydratase n=1 Tax=Piscinibacter sakaiensis TaxID=1547922 RepID=A0A0K8P6A5_PISS1|nr:CaiB/BaiF CoA-transferase family protein [Piscinibacter sakaiensis]GAP38131.1 putative hydroxyproline dehydratase [Piscinibacter sakaiensis]